MAARALPYAANGYTYGEGPDGRRVCRGAMMGRPSLGKVPAGPVRVRRVPLGASGHDPGGAYWGDRPPGVRLWCGFSFARDFVRYVDAANSAEAAHKIRGGA